METKKRAREFSREFKVAAVLRMRAGESTARLAEELGVRRHLLSHFHLAAVFQVRRDPGRAECVATDQRLYSRSRRTSTDHEIHFRLTQTPIGELPRLAFRRAEEGSVLLRPYARGFDVCRDVQFEVVMRRHLVALATLFMEPHPPPMSLKIPILDVHGHCGADTRKCVHHQTNERAITETDDVRRINAVEGDEGGDEGDEGDSLN